ncbi:MAG: class 1 isoprenoid biosynthesis enzyme [Planctomycetota bacterium]|jgi:hypothetical protein
MGNPTSVHILVERAVQQFAEIWWESDTHMPQLGDTYSEQDKLSREAHFERLLHTFESEQEQKSPCEGECPDTEETFFSAFRTFLKSALDFEDDHLDVILSRSFKEATKKFVKMGRCFDPSMDLDDIFQACRNVWTMNGLQHMLDLPIELTPAVFAYSMLYPYSDNYLDNPAISAETKIAFNTRLSRRLAGEAIVPADSYEQIIFDLIGMIEAQYERSRYPQVFDSLLAIHHAQMKSLCLLAPKVPLPETDVLKISIEKGGTSLLADGYLVSGSLTESQEKFLFGYGAYLQLVDDLQDVQEDSKAGLLTVFSQASRHFPLDSFANRTYHFGNKVMDCVDGFEGKDSGSFIDLMGKSIVMLIVEAVGFADGFYSRSYVRELESYSPFRFSFLKKHRRSTTPYRISLMRLLEKFTAEGE